MLEILPGTDHRNLARALEEAHSGLSQVGSTREVIDRFNAFLTWAGDSARVLRYQLSVADIDRLITTRIYWSLLGTNPLDYGPALSPLLNAELEARDSALRAERGMLAANLTAWGRRRALAVVPDTTVFVELGDRFPEVDWHKRLDVPQGVTILVVVTMAAVAELDRKKLSRDNSDHGRKVRAGVRDALRRIEELFPDNHARHTVAGHLAPVVTVLLTDDLAHRPLPDADAEMISRGVSVLPYAGRAMLVTYDVGQTFRARAAGIEAHRLRYEYEDVPDG